MIPRHLSRCLGTAAFLLLSALPCNASAQDDATIEMARQRFREGVTFYDQRSYEKARLAFLQAYALKPHPSVLLNLAQSELRSGHPEDAAAHFSEFLRTPDTTAAEKQSAENGFSDAKAKVAEISVAVDATGAQVFVDGADKGATPLPAPLYLMPGNHTIEARLNDRRATRAVTVVAGQTLSMTLPVRNASAGAAPPTPPPSKTEEEDDGTEVEKPVLAETPADAGGGGSIEADTGGRKNFFTWYGETPVAWVGTGVGVVGLGLGVTFALLSKNDYDNANSLKDTITQAYNDRVPEDRQAQFESGGHAPCNPPSDLTPYPKFAAAGATFADACERFQERADSGDTNKTIAIASTIVGAVALAGTAVYYFVDPNAEEGAGEARAPGRVRARVYPVTGPGYSGIGVAGTF